MKKALSKIWAFQKIIILIMLLTPSFAWFLGSGYFNMHDDLQVMRIFEIQKCFVDLQIPCRWSPDMTYGYGQAMFNFYSTFPYYLGYFYKVIFSASILGTIKFLFLVSLLTGGVGMYKLSKKFWGFWGGIISAVLYTYAPYHAVDVYVRGALAESFALAALPFVWLYIYELINRKNKLNILKLAFWLFVVLTSHNISTLIYAPVTVLWAIFWLVRTRNLKSAFNLLLSGFLGVGLSAFFIIPAIFEQNLIQTDYLISEYSQYWAHFVSLNQLFISRFWGDGGSIFGLNDGMSFAVGWPHWWAVLLMFVIGLSWLIFKKKRESGVLVIFFTFLFLISVFLTHQKSYLIWKSLPIMKFIQFPWRFLGLVIFFAALSVGAVNKLNVMIRYIFIFLILLLTFIFNIRYFVPISYSRLITDKDKLSGVSYELLQKGGYADYLPKGVQTPPESTASVGPKLVEGEGEIYGFVKRTNGFEFNTELTSDSKIVLPIVYFPKWIVLIDGIEQTLSTNGAHNVLEVSVPVGSHKVMGQFVNTNTRTVANYITFISFFLFIFSFIYIRKSKSKLSV